MILDMCGVAMHVLVSTWVSSVLSGFFPPLRDMQTGGLTMLNYAKANYT